jgi:hypothetical protein
MTAPLFICSETRVLRWSRLVGIEILTYYMYAPVSALRPPCPRASHDNKKRCL